MLFCGYIGSLSGILHFWPHDYKSNAKLKHVPARVMDIRKLSRNGNDGGVVVWRAIPKKEKTASGIELSLQSLPRSGTLEFALMLKISKLIS
eukprot:2254042-Amphidinium_carterae.1